jgi:hypothetical protein
LCVRADVDADEARVVAPGDPIARSEQLLFELLGLDAQYSPVANASAERTNVATSCGGFESLWWYHATAASVGTYVMYGMSLPSPPANCKKLSADESRTTPLTSMSWVSSHAASAHERVVP